MTSVLSSSLDGAAVLVTGARGGIGRAVCASLAAAGARVVGTDIGARPEDLKVDLWITHDVTSADDWRQVLQATERELGRLDCLVNSAGICPLDSAIEISMDSFRRTMSVNVESVLLGTQASIPLLRKSAQDREGGSAIVNMASTAGVRGVAYAAAYCASKGAVTLMTKAMAKEFATLKYGIRVNSVHPSSVESEMMDANFARFVELGASPSIQTAREKSAAGNPMGRMARPEDIAGGIVFLCTPAARFINGAEFMVDGGLTA